MPEICNIHITKLPNHENISSLRFQPAVTCSKLTIKTPERRHSSVSIVNLDQVNTDWDLTALSNGLFDLLKLCN